MRKNDKKRKSRVPAKSFDVLAWKRRVQAKIHEELKDLTPAQELDYWRKAAERGPRGEQWKKLHAQAEAARRNRAAIVRRRRQA